MDLIKISGRYIQITSSYYHWWCIVRNPSTQFWVYLQAKWGCVTNCKTFRFIRKIKVDNLGSICTIWNKCFVFCFVQQLASTHWDHNKAIQNWYYTFLVAVVVLCPKREKSSAMIIGGTKKNTFVLQFDGQIDFGGSRVHSQFCWDILCDLSFLEKWSPNNTYNLI